MSESHVDLPLVDLDSETGHDALEKALYETGFFLLADHVIPRELLDGVRRTTNEFLQQPVEVKRRYHMEGRTRGWTGFDSESVGAGYGIENDHGDADACEKFSMGPIVTQEMRDANPEYYNDPAARWYFQDNLFPNKEMEAKWSEYYERMQNLCVRLVDMVRDCLDLPADAWAEYNSLPPSVLRLNAYPDSDRSIRMGAHRDDSLITILHQSMPNNGFAALQIQLPGETTWRSVPPSDRHFVVNIGEPLTYLSGGRVVATRHRVVGPPADQVVGSSRTSLVHFYVPNWNSRLKPLLQPTGGQKTQYDAPELREADGTVSYSKAQLAATAKLYGKS
ncbi:MAG: 2OG-Fe(II) oxygenase family protein [Rubripirellula sp.]